MFERLNTGSVALTAQELRNSVYRGTLNELLHELAELPAFRACLGNRADPRMAFEELVLRFFALDDDLLNYRPSLKVFLNHYMRDNSDLADDVLVQKRQRFVSTIERVAAVYGNQSFRRAYRTEDGRVEVSTAVNSALYDAVMLNFARLDDSAGDLGESAAAISAATNELMLDDRGFIDAISLATGDRGRLRRRVRLLGERLEGLGFSSGLPVILHEPTPVDAEHTGRQE